QPISAVARVEGLVHRAVEVDASDAVAEKGIVGGERATDDNVLVRLNRQGEDGGIGAGEWVVRRLVMGIVSRLKRAGRLIVNVKANRHYHGIHLARPAILKRRAQFNLEVLVELGKRVIIDRDQQ